MVETTRPADAPPDTLDLRIHLPRSIFRGTRPILCRLMLRNSGGAPVLLNQRMLLDLRFSASEVYFVIEDRTGHVYAYRPIVMARPVSADDFQPLDPGEEIVVQYDLRELYGIGKGGAFTAQAGYRNRSPHPDASRRAWIGEVLSNTLEFYTQ